MQEEGNPRPLDGVWVEPLECGGKEINLPQATKSFWCCECSTPETGNKPKLDINNIGLNLLDTTFSSRPIRTKLAYWKWVSFLSLILAACAPVNQTDDNQSNHSVLAGGGGTAQKVEDRFGSTYNFDSARFPKSFSDFG